MICVWISLIGFFVISVLGQEDNRCSLENGTKGKCVVQKNCIYAEALKDSKISEICGYTSSGATLICCPSRLPGTASIRECKKYHEEVTSRPEFNTQDGLLAKPKEFPHLAVFGYQADNKSEIPWLCDGNLISDQFVLSASVCANPIQYGPPKMVRLGELDFKSDSKDAKPVDFTIIRSYFFHRKLHEYNYYNDIALFKLDRKVQFSDYIRPACLNTERAFDTTKLSTAGWGKKEYLGDMSSHLLKVVLKYMDQDRCSDRFKNKFNRKLKFGIVEDSQICAAAEEGRNTCPAVSGGPLQVKVDGTSTSSWYYSIVGITSFGSPCGVADDITVFTRVSNYIAWIEDIVWPSLDIDVHDKNQ